ncbi:YfhO family protein [Ferruginibacter sp.]|nr:YfhO family protein [Ferruginibacter sp.]
MNAAWFKKALPHFIAIGIFLLVSVIFCKPALNSDLTLQQSDITQFKGMSHQLLEREKEKGASALWMTNMFSGMPSYQVTYPVPSWGPITYIHNFFTLFLPNPINFFFLMCISMYFLLLVLKTRPWTAIIGALAFAFCSYTPIALTAGHETKMFTLAYVPATLAAMVLIFDKKYLWGFTLTALFTALQLGMNHQQINYYFFIIAVIMSVAYLVTWIKQKQLVHAGKSFGLLLIAAIIGIGVNSLNLWVNADYTKSSKRGGMLVMDKKDSKNDVITKDSRTSGLQKDYAFQWSYGKMESFSLMFPGITGYGSYYAVSSDGEQHIFPKLTNKSNVYKQLTEKLNVPDDQAENFTLGTSQNIYWGDQPFTNGPVYLGAIICFLGILGLFVLDNKHKWWLLTGTVLGILMAMGKNLPGFNYFLFDHLPLYNKFRVPTMTLVVPQILVPVLAALTLDHIVTYQQENATWKKLKLGVIATLAIFIIIGGFYFTSDFSAENKARTRAINEMLQSKAPQEQLQEKYNAINNDPAMQQLRDNKFYEEQVLNNRIDDTNAKGLLTALRKDRAALLGKDILSSLVFVLIAAAFIALYIKKKIKTAVLIAGVTLAAFIDLFSFDTNYLNVKSFAAKTEVEDNPFPLSKADNQILQDKDPNYRVFDMSKSDPFQQSQTSYYHKSIGGYSPAKLGIYDDLITYQLSGTPNPAVLNMLNAKYIIQPGQKQGEEMAIPNPGALGNCWLVKGVTYVDNAVAEMKALNNFDPRDTAVIDKMYQSKIGNFAAPDSTSYIKQTAFDNDEVKYESNTTAQQLAVFSEVYYKDWNAYIDGKKVDVIKANYVLRALVVPAGKHNIEFKLEPNAYITGVKLYKIFNFLLLALLAFTIIWSAKKYFGNKRASANE